MDLVDSLLKFLVFQTENFGQKNQIGGGGRKTPCHFGQLNYNMSIVTGVVFLTHRIRII
jgi:hypothetical protein